MWIQLDEVNISSHPFFQGGPIADLSYSKRHDEQVGKDYFPPVFAAILAVCALMRTRYYGALFMGNTGAKASCGMGRLGFARRMRYFFFCCDGNGNCPLAF